MTGAAVRRRARRVTHPKLGWRGVERRGGGPARASSRCSSRRSSATCSFSRSDRIRAPSTDCCSRGRGATRTASGQVLYKATTLTFTGLAVAIGLRAGLFNIGAESQLAAGGFVAALVGLAAAGGHCPRWSTLAVVPRRRGARRRRSSARVPGRAQGEVRRARSDHDDHAQLHRARAAELSRPSRTSRCPGTLHTAEIHAGALPRLSDVRRRPSTARRRTS